LKYNAEMLNSDLHNRQTSLRNHFYTWRELIKLITQQQSNLLLANTIAILGALTSVPVPLLIPLLVDEVLLDKPGIFINTINELFPESWQNPTNYILTILLLTLFLRLLSLVFGVWQARQFTLISKDIIYSMRSSLLLRLSKFSMSEYEVLGSGKVASHLVTDLDTIDEFVSSGTSKFIVALLSVIGTAIVLLLINWQLALFILFLNPLVIYVTTLFGHKVKDLKNSENSAYQHFQESLSETLDAIQEIRANNREKFYIGKLIESAFNVKKHSATFTWKSDAANRLSFVVFIFGFDIFRALSMLMVLYSDLTIGQMLAVFAYLWFMMGPVQELLSIQYSFHSAKAALHRINQLIDVPLEPQYEHKQNPFESNSNISIEVKDLSFAYGNGPNILNNINFKIKPGEKIALVGASGGGKTTFVQILLGLYLPNKGEVYFNGVATNQIGLDVIRNNVAIVLQNPAMFNDSIRNNLTLGKNKEDSAILNALDIAQLKTEVLAMPNQLDTIVGKSGIRLSGGQRQRLAIARLVLSEPAVVIFDEATSALDSQTENKLHIALQEFLKNRTTVIVAHRLSAVLQADKALVFEDGHIVEQGSHSDLIKNNGLYSRLYSNQTQ